MRSRPGGRLQSSCYLLVDEAAPPGPLDAAAPPPLEPPVVLEAAPPPLGPLDDDAPPAPELLVPPMPLGLELAPPGELGELDDELDEPGAGAVVVDEEEDDPPGTTIVSFSLVTVLVGGLPPGITVVVSLRSHAERARAPAKTNR